MTNEIMTKLKNAKSVEDILAIAKEDGKELTVEQAQQIFDQLHGGGELSDDNLENVAGGASENWITETSAFHDWRIPGWENF